jgi:hypothetical protein
MAAIAAAVDYQREYTTDSAASAGLVRKIYCEGFELQLNRMQKAVARES